MSIQKRPDRGLQGVDKQPIHWEEDLKPFTRLPREPRKQPGQRAPIWIPALVSLALIAFACSVIYSFGQRNLPSSDQMLALLRSTPTRPVPTAAVTEAPRATATRYSAATDTPVPSATPRPGSAAGPGDLRVGGYGRVTGAGDTGLNFRKDASLTGQRLRSLPDESAYEIVGGPVTADGVTWWQLKDKDGTFGWVSATYLRPSAKP